jgi:hypothetical protein
MTSNIKTPKTLEIFRAGTHTSGSGDRRTWTRADLQEIAATYDTERFKAPLIVSHNTDGVEDHKLPDSELAYGYPDSLKVVGDKLIGSFSKIVPQVSSWIKNGQIFAVSPSIYLPNSPANPTPGKFSLRHIALLGKSPPAVKGMEAPSFSIPITDFEADAIGVLDSTFECSFDFSTDEPMTTKSATLPEVQNPEYMDMPDKGKKKKPMPIEALEDEEEDDGEDEEEEMMPPAKKGKTAKSKTSDMSESVSPADFAALKTELAAIKKQAEQERQVFALRQAEQERKEVQSFVDQSVADGRLLPTHKDAWVASLLAIPTSTAVSYSEGEKPSSVRDRIQQLISEMPSVVEFGEMAGVDSAPKNSSQTQGFSAVDGYTLDPESSKTMQAALAYCEKHSMNPQDSTQLVTAIQAVSK